MNPKPTIAELTKRLAKLEAQQEWMNRVFEAYGIKGLWHSPAKAAEILGISRDRVMAEIERAERNRALKKKTDLVHGVHYRNVADAEAQQPTWQIHITEFDRFLAIPPDERQR